MKSLWMVVLLATGASRASEPGGFTLWTGSELRALERALGPKVNAGKFAMQPLAAYGNHACMLAHREGDGEAELHETQNDIFFVQSGEATLIAGGAMVKPRTSAPHEVRGAGIEGGSRQKLAAGDVVHIPIKTPHQLLVSAGHQFTYFVVKVDEPQPAKGM